jgi:hypothetical protein
MASYKPRRPKPGLWGWVVFHGQNMVLAMAAILFGTVLLGCAFIRHSWPLIAVILLYLILNKL